MNLYITLFLALISFDTLSCDVCGGITASGNEGLLLNNEYHFIGVKQSYSAFSSIHRNHSNENVTHTQEHFLRSSLIGKWQFAEKFSSQIEIPFILNIQESESESRSEKGIGDINLLCNYVLVNRKNDDANKSHLFRAGLGVSIPTGNYSKNLWETSNLSPGTGAFNFIGNTNYIFRMNDIGILQENIISLTGTNKFGYKYGTSLLSRNSFFLRKKIKEKTLLTPSVGVNYLYTSTDRINGIKVSELFNSGHSINGELALNYLIKKWMFILRTSYPIYQNIGNGDVKSKGVVEFGIYHIIEKK